MTETDFQTMLASAIQDADTFVSATFSGRQRNTRPEWEKISLRPVELKGQRHLQVLFWDGQQTFTRNFNQHDAPDILHELLAAPHNNFFVRTTSEDIQVRISKKGKVRVHRAANVVLQPDLSHNRIKSLLLPEDRPDAFLQASGIMSADGTVKASKRAKFVQINRFLDLVTETVNFDAFDHTPLQLLDCGCGSAYLTFAVHHYINDVLNIPAETVGVDVNVALLQRHAEISDAMGWENINFESSSIIDYQPGVQPDIVLALHACDTATDEALAVGIMAESPYIFSVPCCHHHLQVQLQQDTPSVLDPVMRHNILRERMGDILTDTFRALILRIMGYNAQVVEFVSPEHTAKNLMIRAQKTTSPGDPRYVAEYLRLCELWQVEPYLATLLGERFAVLLEQSPAQ